MTLYVLNKITRHAWDHSRRFPNYSL